MSFAPAQERTGDAARHLGGMLKQALPLGLALAFAACVTMDEDEDVEFRDGCEDGVEEYIDQNGEEVICVYTDEPGDGGGDEEAGDDNSDPCWANPWLCSGDDWGDDGGYDDGGYDDGGGEAGGGDGGDAGSCYDKMFSAVRTGKHASQHDARIIAIEAARSKARADCTADWYYVGWLGAYCNAGVPDNEPWSNANSWVHGCTQGKDYKWTCTAESSISCEDYTYHGW
jgi:hypothetical protein